MAVLFIVCGLPFSGKTTLARRLAEHAGGLLVAYDALWAEKFRELGRSLEWEELTQMAEGRLAEALARNRSAIYDTLNDTKDYRDRLRRIAEAQGADAVVVFTNTPLHIIRERQRRNEVTRERHSVSPENFQAAFDKFQSPGADEPVLEFRPEDDLSVWLERVRL